MPSWRAVSSLCACESISAQARIADASHACLAIRDLLTRRDDVSCRFRVLETEFDQPKQANHPRLIALGSRARRKVPCSLMLVESQLPALSCPVAAQRYLGRASQQLQAARFVGSRRFQHPLMLSKLVGERVGFRFELP